MKIAAALLVGLLAYVVAASNGDEGVAGKEPVAHHQVILRPTTRAPFRTNPPRRIYRRPTTVVRRTPRRRGIFGNIDLRSLALAMLFSRLLFPTTTQDPTTTETPTTTTKDETTTADVTTAPEATTTQDQFAGWRTIDTCRYIRPAERKTWTDANTDCNDRVTGAQLVSAAFNKAALDRTAFIDRMELGSLSYWIGTTANGAGVGNANDPATNDEWLLSGRPSTVPDPLEVLDVEGVDAATQICGRFRADSSPTEVLFENCDDEEFYYVCEYCGTV